MKSLLLLSLFAIVSLNVHAQAEDFTTNQSPIYWNASAWEAGFGHKLYSLDPGFHTDLRFAVRNNSTIWTDLMTLTSEGKIGIGTTSPDFKLDVNGTIRSTQDLYADRMAIDHPIALDDWNSPWQNAFFDGFNSNNAPEPGWFWGINLGHRSNSPNYKYGGQMIILNSAIPTLYIRNRNEKGEGDWAKVLHNKGDQQISGALTVDGVIRAEEIKVEIIAANNLNVEGQVFADQIKVRANGQTADFVFEEGYDLKPIEEVEAFVKENKHLPNIPSANDMEANGVDLAEMNKLLLQKVEELTLYMISQENARNAEAEMRIELEQKVKQQQNLLNSLSKSIVEIKELLEAK